MSIFPQNHLPGSQTMNEDGSLLLSFATGNAISVSDDDSTTLSIYMWVSNGTMTFADTTGLSFIGSNGIDDVTMTFSGTVAAINAAFASGLTYTPDANYNGTDYITLETNDGGPPSSAAFDWFSIAVNSVNDAPSGADGTITVSENDNYYFTAADFGYSDVDGNAFNGITFTTVPAAGTLHADMGGGNIITITAGTVLAGGGFAAIISGNRLWYTPPADEFGDDYASFTFQVEDNGGFANGGQFRDQSPNTITIDIERVNELPVVDLNGADAGIDYATTFIEDGVAVAIGAGITVTDEDVIYGDVVHGAVVTLTDRVAGDSLTFATPLPNGFGAIFTSNANTITIEISGVGTAEQYQAILQSLVYSTTNQNPTVGDTDPSRTITVTVNDGFGDSLAATTTVNITPVDDLPVAQPDAFTIPENGTITGASLFADNGSGPDTDPDGPPLAIAAVNGSAANVGTTITLASGASLTVNANGTFDYNPGSVFLPTPTADSGASNTPAHDSFTYTLAGAGTVTVTITLTGLDTDDLLLGTAGVDVLMAGVGNDTLLGGASGDTLNGGADTDTASYRTATSGVTVSLTNSGGGTGDAAGDSFISIENLEGSAFADILMGDAAANALSGGAGNDVLAGGAGADMLDGGDGRDTASYRTSTGPIRASLSTPGSNFGDAAGDSYISIENLEGSAHSDLLVGNSGANDFFGGGGGDVVSYYYASAGVVASLTNITASPSPNVTQTGEAAGDRYDSIEVLEGSLFNDVLFAGTAGSSLRGLDGNDTLYGRGGSDILIGDAGQDVLLGDDGTDWLEGGDDADTLRGDAGADQLFGQAGDDRLDGSAGADILDGGTGNDMLTGGAGADVFEIDDLGGTDTITDFKRNQGDKIDLRSLNIDEWIGTQAFHNDAGEVRIRNAGAEWWLEGDTNGDGVADFSVAMGNLKLIETDIVMGSGPPV